MRGGVTKPTGKSYNFDKVWSNVRFGKLFVIMDANNFDKSPSSIFFIFISAGKFTHIISSVWVFICVLRHMQRYFSPNVRFGKLFVIMDANNFDKSPSSIFFIFISAGKFTHIISSIWVFICVLRHMQRYFSHICDGTDVQADRRRSCTYGRAPNVIDIS